MGKQKYNIAGQRFGKLVAIKPITVDGRQKWLCKCDCGNDYVVYGASLRRGATRSCGCAQSENRVKYHAGQRFGNVVLLQLVGNRGYWKMQCDCGTEFVSRVNPYKNGKYRTCGCSRYDGSKQAKHNQSRTNTYHIWQGMKRRCNNPNNASYKDYGGRGIKVCDRWLNSFENFIADMGKRPSKKHSIDRIDVDGDYCPENCRWATKKEQANNTTKTIHITHDGVTHSICEWCDIYGIPYRTAHGRYDSGYPFEKIFSKTPVTRKLTDEEVRAIRVGNLNAVTFLERFGKKISNSTLRNVKNHKAYIDVI